MTDYINVRASEILDQHELVAFLKSRFAKTVQLVGRQLRLKGTACVEVKVRAKSAEFDEIRSFIEEKRRQGADGFCNFPIGWHLRRYSNEELRQAEILKLHIVPHFDSPGAECGTIYETQCTHCNLGRQVSDLITDLRLAPQQKDIAETIARVEWIVSSRFEKASLENKLVGADFKEVFDFRTPMRRSETWRQLWVRGRAGRLAEATIWGRDPFSPNTVSWRCPVGHSTAAQFLSELYLHRSLWDGSDIAVTVDLLGQGRGFIRPVPLIIISQRMFRVIQSLGLTGFSFEVAHFV